MDCASAIGVDGLPELEVTRRARRGRSPARRQTLNILRKYRVEAHELEHGVLGFVASCFSLCSVLHVKAVNGGASRPGQVAPAWGRRDIRYCASTKSARGSRPVRCSATSRTSDRRYGEPLRFQHPRGPWCLGLVKIGPMSDPSRKGDAGEAAGTMVISSAESSEGASIDVACGEVVVAKSAFDGQAWCLCRVSVRGWRGSFCGKVDLSSVAPGPMIIPSPPAPVYFLTTSSVVGEHLVLVLRAGRIQVVHVADDGGLAR